MKGWDERRRRALGLAAVALAGFGPPFVLMATGWTLATGALVALLATCALGAALGAAVLADARRKEDVPAGAFGALAILAALGWTVGFALPFLLF